MTIQEWISGPVNWFFIVVALIVIFCALRVVTAHNVVHSALYLVASMAGVAVLFLMLGAEFLAWALVLVYIGAVLVLFLFGIMITRAPTGLDEGLSSSRKILPALMAVVLFGLMSWASIQAFGTSAMVGLGPPADTAVLGEALLGRFVIPFEVVGFILTAALIGGITIARRDLTPLEEEERQAI